MVNVAYVVAGAAILISPDILGKIVVLCFSSWRRPCF